MVATTGLQDGKRWRLAPCLEALFEEADRLFPGRSTASDGTIGDPAHANRDSDHNPDASGDVLAGDLTDDKTSGCDADALADHLVASRDPRMKYVIRNGEIAKSYVDSAGRPAWTWQPYTGTNVHAAHTHISVLDTQAAKRDTSPWWPQPASPPLPVVPSVEPAEDTMLIKRKSNPAHALLYVGGKLFEAHGSTGEGPVVDDGVWNKLVEKLGPVIPT